MPRFLGDIGGKRQQPSRGGEQRDPGTRQRETPGLAQEESDAEFFLQRLDLRAGCALGHVEALRGARERAAFGDRRERAKLIKLHLRNR